MTKSFLTKKIFSIFAIFTFVLVSTTTLTHAGVIQNIKYFLFGEPTTPAVVTTPITNPSTSSGQAPTTVQTPPSTSGISENDLYLALTKISRLPDNIISQLRGPQGPKGDTGAKGSSGLSTYSNTGATPAPITNVTNPTTIVYTGSSGGSSSSASYWKKDGHDIYYDRGGVGINTNTPGANLTIQSSDSVEKITNGDFDGNANGWTLGTGWVYDNDDGKITHTPGEAENAHQSVSLTKGKTYSYSISVTDGPICLLADDQFIQYIDDDDSGTFTGKFTAQSDTSSIIIDVNDCTEDNGLSGSVTNVSVQELSSAFAVNKTDGSIGLNVDNASNLYIGGKLSVGNKSGIEGGLYHDYSDPIFDLEYNSTDPGVTGMEVAIVSDPAVDGGSVFGSGVAVGTEYTNTTHFSQIVGTSTYAYHSGTGIVDILKGADFSTNNYNSGTITDSRAGQFSIYNAGTMTNTYGVYIDDVTSGTQTNQAYGLYQSDAEARNYFAGNLGIGTDAPASTLDIEKTLSTNGTGIINYHNTTLPASGYFYGIDSETSDEGTANNTQVTSIYGGAKARGSGTGKTLYGFYGNNLASGSVTVANEYGYFNSLGVFNTATVTNSYGAYLDQAYGSHTSGIVNNYGLYVVDHAGIGSNSSYNIYSAGAGLNYFGGNVGIGNTTPSVALDVTGDIEYTGTITDVSDRRLKDNIQDYTGALDIISNLQAKSYNMISTPDKSEVGFIAQDVQSIFPNATSIIDPEKGYLGVSYVSLVPVIAEAVKELNLKLIDINKTEEPNSIREAIVGWFSNTANGIVDFFAGRVHTETLCVGTNGDETCITKGQLDQLLQGNSIVPQTPPNPDPTPDPTPEPDPVPEPDPTPDPAPEITPPGDPVPDAVPPSDPAPDPTPAE